MNSKIVKFLLLSALFCSLIFAVTKVAIDLYVAPCQGDPNDGGHPYISPCGDPNDGGHPLSGNQTV